MLESMASKKDPEANECTIGLLSGSRCSVEVCSRRAHAAS